MMVNDWNLTTPASMLTQLLILIIPLCYNPTQGSTNPTSEENEQPKKYYEDNLSLTKPFQQEYAWDISGSAMITDRYIRLTPDQKSQQGSIWSKVKHLSKDSVVT